MSDSADVEITPTHKCSFCGKNNAQVRGAMIAGPGVCICQQCVFRCVEMIFECNEKSSGVTKTK